MVELQRRGIDYRHIDTGQHSATTKVLRETFDLPEPNFSFSRSDGDIVSTVVAIRWFISIMLRGFFNRRWLRNQVFPGGGLCLIHGDTLSTLMGMYLARWAGLQIGHVEAGLRSFKILDPFPEEFIRILCMKRANLLFAPSPEAAENLKNMRVNGKIVEIEGNTVLDSLELISDRKSAIQPPAGNYALATCHRLETISSRDRLQQVVELLNKVASQMPLVLVTHGPTYRKLERYDLAKTLHKDIVQYELLNYVDFVGLLKNAHMVLTDGGSIQEECAALGKPCLILRNATERPDGLGENARLWRFDAEALRAFLEEVKTAAPVLIQNRKSPSELIVRELLQADCG